MTVKLPSLNAQAVSEGGQFTQEWVQFFTRLAAAPGPIVPVAVAASPLSFTAPGDGALAIAGGTVTSVTFTRGRASATVPAGMVPLSQGDAVTVDFTAAPTVSFIPR